MVDLLLDVAQIMVVVLALYNLAVALAGWRQPGPAPVAESLPRFRIVVPAHNEAAVLGTLLADLERMEYPADRVRLVVLADHCSDATAAIASAAGVEVVERDSGAAGKGPALAWLLDRHPLEGDALVVLDADNRVPPNMLTRLAGELGLGHQAVQVYLDVSNPDRSLVATASALSYWASNRMVQLSRTNLGWTADLGGTGMCLTQEALTAGGSFGSSLAEDQELGVKLELAGIPVVWVHDVRVRDEKPAGARVAARQRGRWASGRRTVARRHTLDLLLTRRWSSIDLAIRLNQPSRIGMAMLAALIAVGSAASLPLWPWQIWLTVALIQFLAPIPFLVRDGVEPRYLIRYPLLVVLPLIKIWGRIRRPTGWYHTPHEGSDER